MRHPSTKWKLNLNFCRPNYGPQIMNQSLIFIINTLYFQNTLNLIFSKISNNLHLSINKTQFTFNSISRFILSQISEIRLLIWWLARKDFIGFHFVIPDQRWVSLNCRDKVDKNFNFPPLFIKRRSLTDHIYAQW